MSDEDLEKDAPVAAAQWTQEAHDETPDGTKTDAATTAGRSTLDMLWENAVARWDEDKAHTAFLEFAAAKGELPEAAGRYRAIKDAGGPRKDLAEKKLAAITLIAIQMLASERSDPPKKAPKWLSFVAFVISFSLVAWVASIVLRR